MKLRLALFATLVTASILSAQTTSTVPALMSYQGRVTDAAGVLIGGTAPTNRTVTFRFYAEPTGGEVLYAESQTVTISGGEFSVLIGNGTGVSGSPGPSTPASTQTNLGEVVNAAASDSLYLGITVDDGNSGTADAEIAPRQQLVSGAYALRSLVAESVASGAVTSAMIDDGAVGTNQLAAGAINSGKIADGAITHNDIAGSTITAANLDTNSIGLWTPSGGNVYRNGNVGIGQSNPGVPLNFASEPGNKIALHGNGGNHYGFGIQNALLQIYTSGSGSDVAFGYGNSAAMTETMRIKGNGNVGIGISTPSAKLHVNGGSAIIQNTSNPFLKLTSGGAGSTELALAGATGSFSSSASANDTVLRATGKLHLQSGTGAAALTIDTANNLSVAKNLSVANGLSAKALAVHSNFTSHSQGASLEWNKLNGDGATWLLNQKGGGGGGIIFGEVDNENGVTERMRIAGNGRVGIGTTNTGQGNLSVYGTIASVGSNNGSPGYARMYYETGGRIVFEGYNTYLNNGQWRGFSMDGNNDLDWRSDARLKENVEDAEPMLDRLMQVDFRRYNWIGSSDKHKEFGVIAQELEPLFPDLVGQGADGYLTVGYTSFATIAAKSLQELKIETDGEIEALKRELKEKETRIADLEARLDALERLISNSR